MITTNQKAGKTIARIGEAAGVVTEPETRRTPSAHDLRRAFGARSSRPVMPAALKGIMRHADVQATMTFYVAQGAHTTAGELWEALRNKLGNIEPKKQYTRQEPQDTDETGEKLHSAHGATRETTRDNAGNLAAAAEALAVAVTALAALSDTDRRALVATLLILSRPVVSVGLE